ncbi:hypothetical protein D9M71_449790 [compost metagenome]
MADVVHVHRVHQHEVRAVAHAQALRVGEEVRIRVMVGVVEMAVLDRQLRRIGVSVAGGFEGRAVVELADPVIGGRCGLEPGGAGVVEDAALPGEARDIVVDDAALDRRHAGEDAFVERAGQRRQLAFELVQGGPAGPAVGLQVTQRMPGHLKVQAIQQNEDDFVLHITSLKKSLKL